MNPSVRVVRVWPAVRVTRGVPGTGPATDPPFLQLVDRDAAAPIHIDLQEIPSRVQTVIALLSPAQPSPAQLRRIATIRVPRRFSSMPPIRPRCVAAVPVARRARNSRRCFSRGIGDIRRADVRIPGLSAGEAVEASSAPVHLILVCHAQLPQHILELYEGGRGQLRKRGLRQCASGRSVVQRVA